MRDILTFLAGLLILVLVAALVVPPLVDWRSYRDVVDAAITRAAGAPASTEGTLAVRLLPAPRLKIERLRLGSVSSGAASLGAQSVKAEIALTPLLHGEVRFLASRVGRMEVKLPTGAGRDWRLPGGFLKADSLQRAWVFEDLAVSQLLLTSLDPDSGRTEQFSAEGVRLQSQSLAGPWRAEGQIGGAAFTLATGPIEIASPTSVKLSLDKPAQPHLSLDAKLVFVPQPDGTLAPSLDGSVRAAGTPETSGFSFLASATIKTGRGSAELTDVTVEGGPDAPSVRLNGVGRATFAPPLVFLDLEGRRLDLDAIAAARAQSDGGKPAGRLGLGLPLDLALRLDNVTTGGEDLSGVAFRGSLRGEEAEVASLSFAVAGQTRVNASGTVSLQPGSAATGRVEISSQSADRFPAYLAKLGLGQWPVGLFVGRAIDASAEVTAAHPVVSLRSIRLRSGETTLSGSLRYTSAEPGTRARLDAQLAAQGLDLAAFAAEIGSSLPERTPDLGLILDARDVRYGPGGGPGGRIAARLSSEGDSLVIDRLEIADVAGANAHLSGQIDKDGSGRIAGRLSAKRAAPLLDLAGQAWLQTPLTLVPAALRQGPMDLAISSERRTGGTGGAVLATKLDGTVSGASLAAEIVSGGGQIASLDARFATESAGAMLGLGRRTDALPLNVKLTSGRDGSGRLASSLEGDIAGLHLRTTRAATFLPEDGVPETGALELTGPDARPLLTALGIGPVPATPLPLKGRAEFGRVAGVPRIQLSGEAGGVAVEGDLFGPAANQLGGSVSVSRMSLPWLAAAFSAGEGRPATSGIWSTARFDPARTVPVGGTVAVKAPLVDLGGGVLARSAEFTLSLANASVGVRDLTASLLGGSVSGQFDLNRQDSTVSLIGQGSLAGTPFSALTGQTALAGRLSTDLRFGGSGESVAAIVSSLSGVGRAEVENLEVPGVGPGAVSRSAARALRTEDPLNQSRLRTIVAEELARGPFRSGTISGPVSLIGGALRLSPIVAAAEAATWQGSAAYDLRNVTIDLKGSLTAKVPPRGWVGAPPYVALGWTGPAARPERTIDVGPLANGLASMVLARELDRIETFELDAAERARLNARVEMDRARKAAAEEAARLAHQREEAERLARQREEAERARLEAERVQNAAGGRTDPGGLLRPIDPPLLAPPRFAPQGRPGAGG